MIEPVSVPILLDLELEEEELDLSVEEAEEYAAQIGSLITISEVYGGLPSGGNAGEILIKNSDEDYDAIWGNINFPTEVFYATYGVTTADEIKAARQAGKAIFLNQNGRIYGLSRFNEGVLTSYEFTAILGRTSYSAYLENSVWSQSSKQLVPIETIGLLHDLNTTDKSSIVNAINEVEAEKIEVEYFDFTWDGDHNPVPAAGVTSTQIKAAVQDGKLVFARVTIGSTLSPTIFSLTMCYDTYIQFNAFESHIIFDELSCSILPNGGLDDNSYVDLWSMSYSVLPDASNNTPQNLGVASPGLSGSFSRADHVHAMPSAVDIGAYVKPNDGIPASDLADNVHLIPSGGTIGQVLKKISNNDWDIDWGDLNKSVVWWTNRIYVSFSASGTNYAVRQSDLNGNTGTPSVDDYVFGPATGEGKIDSLFQISGTLGQSFYYLTPITTFSVTNDYNDLTNKPSINNVTLSGDKSLADLGITSDVFFATYGTTTSAEIEAAFQAGKAVYCIQELLPGEYYCFSLWYKYGSTFHEFAAAEREIIHLVICDSDSWSESYITCYSKPSGGIPASDLASDVHLIPSGGTAGQLIMKKSAGDYDIEWVSPANTAEQDNTLPITSAGVYMEIGNINALLSTI